MDGGKEEKSARTSGRGEGREVHIEGIKKGMMSLIRELLLRSTIGSLKWPHLIIRMNVCR